MEFTSHKPGTSCWVELATTAPDSAKEFYNEIFGWSPEDIPMGENMVYTMLNRDGKPAAAMYKLRPEQEQMNLPPHWLVYFASDNVDITAAKVKEAGGTVVVEPVDVMDEGRLAIISDPEGGMAGIWQAKNHIGSSWKYVHGSLCWAEHGSHGNSESLPFYKKVFGWSSNTQNMEGMEYTTYNIGEEMAAGQYILPEEMKDVPPNWLAYFEVENIDTALSKTQSTGGQVLMPKKYVKGIGHFSVISDPQGAVLGIIQSEQS